MAGTQPHPDSPGNRTTGPGPDPAGELITVRRTERGAAGSAPALAQRAEVAEATVGTLQAHLAGLQVRLRESLERQERMVAEDRQRRRALAGALGEVGRTTAALREAIERMEARHEEEIAGLRAEVKRLREDLRVLATPPRAPALAQPVAPESASALAHRVAPESASPFAHRVAPESASAFAHRVAPESASALAQSPRPQLAPARALPVAAEGSGAAELADALAAAADRLRAGRPDMEPQARGRGLRVRRLLAGLRGRLEGSFGSRSAA